MGSFSKAGEGPKIPMVIYPHTFLTPLPGGNKKLDGGMGGRETDRDGLIAAATYVRSGLVLFCLVKTVGGCMAP